VAIRGRRIGDPHPCLRLGLITGLCRSPKTSEILFCSEEKSKPRPGHDYLDSVSIKYFQIREDALQNNECKTVAKNIFFYASGYTTMYG